MSHFADEIWADLARGSLPESEAVSVVRHVESGCSDCAGELRTWRSLVEILSKESDYEAPAALISKVRRLFAPAREEEPRGAAARIAEVLFDSFASPAPAGLRTLDRSARQMCFQTGNFYVDLRIEEQPGASKASVLGQLMHLPYNDRVNLEGLSVTLSSGAASLASTTTNRLGEFRLDVPTEGDHNIAVGVGDGFAMVVPLRSLRRRNSH